MKYEKHSAMDMLLNKGWETYLPTCTSIIPEESRLEENSKRLLFFFSFVLSTQVLIKTYIYIYIPSFPTLSFNTVGGGLGLFPNECVAFCGSIFIYTTSKYYRFWWRHFLIRDTPLVRYVFIWIDPTLQLESKK